MYNGGCKDRQPEILIIGDSIIRYVEIPGAITYCLSGAKVTVIMKLTSVLIDCHPCAHTLIVHLSTNDVVDKQSVMLRDQLESLAIKTQSLGRTSIFSGPVLAPSKSPKHFSRLYSLHEWLKCYCTATGHGFLGNFDCFWTRHHLHKPDGQLFGALSIRMHLIESAPNGLLKTSYNLLFLTLTDIHLSMTPHQ